MKLLKHLLVAVFCIISLFGLGKDKNAVSPNSSHMIRVLKGNLDLFSLENGSYLSGINLLDKLNINPDKIYTMILSHQGKYALIELEYDGGIYIIDFEKESIQLCLWQWIGAFLFYRVLGCHHHE